jgi:hypothetical protein
LREAFFKFDKEKENILKGYEDQLEELKKQLDEEESLKN